MCIYNIYIYIYLPNPRLVFARVDLSDACVVRGREQGGQVLAVAQQNLNPLIQSLRRRHTLRELIGSNQRSSIHK